MNRELTLLLARLLVVGAAAAARQLHALVRPRASRRRGSSAEELVQLLG